MSKSTFNVCNAWQNNLGGKNLNSFYGDGFVLDVNNLGNGWTSDTSITKRAFHNAHVINGIIYCFGGRGSPIIFNGNTFKIEDDLSFQAETQANILVGIDFFTSIVWNVE